MKKLFFALLLVTFALWLASCSDEPNQPPVTSDVQNRTVALGTPNPSNPSVPEATVPILTFTAPKDVIKISDIAVPATLTPEFVSATLRPGQSVIEHKQLWLDSTFIPPKLDLLIAFDLTGSMGGELANVKANGTNIMNAIKADIPDSWFGVVSAMDYTGVFSGCGYTSSYGSGGDYPYARNQALTDNTADVANAINALTLGFGNDTPEDYTRVLYESYSDAGIGWRDGSKKIVLYFLDSYPHDCAVDAILGGATTSGPDPGRNGIANDADDLAILPVLDAMKAENVTLIPIFSGIDNVPPGLGMPLWTAFSAKTGGEAFEINPDGTIPGGLNIVDFIKNLVKESIVRFDNITLKTCDPMYAGWITSLEPPSYTNVELGVPITLDFDMAITVPPGTPDGEYCFDVCAVGDGVDLAAQHVCITVVNEVDVGFDFHPTSCPNPFNMKSEGVSPAAIVGSPDLDVRTIDPSSIKLAGVPVMRWSYSDVVSLYMPLKGKDDCMDCTSFGPDGYLDLALKFDSPALAAALAGVRDGDCKVVKITGNFKAEFGGGPIVGEDVLKIILKNPKPAPTGRAGN